MSPSVHVVQHLSFLGSALLFWWSLLGPAPRSARGAALASLFITSLHTSALGALLALSARPWCPLYDELKGLLRIDPLLDQQRGGLIMWVPGSAAYFLAALFLAWLWIGFARPGFMARPPRPAALRDGTAGTR
jgi:cytochrome c oxidase assembly factor CtaG